MGHKFERGVYEPASRYPELARVANAARWIKVEECRCGCSRVVFRMTERPRVGGAAFATYWIGNVQQPKAPICLLDE